MTGETGVLGRTRRKHRAGAACDFCRHRKLGCDNAKPRCENCRFHSRDCLYTERAKKERPSNSRISSLEEDNAQLRKLVLKLKSELIAEQTENQKTDPQNVSLASSGPELSNVTSSFERCPPTISQQVSSRRTYLPGVFGHSQTRNRQPMQFHGPSSAIFDQEGSIAAIKINRTAMRDPSEKTLLLAEDAKQRQLECINLRSGRLNFDGIEQSFGMQLLSVFWNRQHQSGPTVYRPCFMRDMACQGPYFSPLLLNAMLFIASKHLEKTAGQCCLTDSCTEAMSFRRRVDEILHNLDTQTLFKSKITTIQALILMSDALFSWCDERSLSWHYLGIAINMIMDLGIHTENSILYRANSHSAEDLEVHRRVFWAAFVQDKVQSIYQGRPARLRESDIRIPLVFLDEYDELEQFNTLGYSANPAQLGCPIYAVSSSEQLCKLSIIADRILCGLYSEHSLREPPEQVFQISNALHAELIGWRERLPEHLIPSESSGPSSILPHTLSLLSMYSSLTILLKRPFVSEGHLQCISDSAAKDAFAICASAASDIDGYLQLYGKHFCLKTTPYFMSYATYVSGTIHVRIAAQMEYGSKAHRCLRTCLEILSEHQIKCHAPRRSLGVLLGLITRLGVDIGDSFAALPSRTSGLEPHGAEIGELISNNVNAEAVNYAQKTSASEQAYQNHEHLDPATLESLDIDEIIKTFDLVSQENSRHPNPYSNADGSNRNTEEPGDGALPVDGTLDEIFQNFNSPLDYDLLFGFGISESQTG